MYLHLTRIEVMPGHSMLYEGGKATVRPLGFVMEAGKTNEKDMSEGHISKPSREAFLLLEAAASCFHNVYRLSTIVVEWDFDPLPESCTLRLPWS